MTSQGTLPLLMKLWPAIRVGASNPSSQDSPRGTPAWKLPQCAGLTLLTAERMTAPLSPLQGPPFQWCADTVSLLLGGLSRVCMSRVCMF